MSTLSYHQQRDIENVKHLRELIRELPPFCADFFRGIEVTAHRGDLSILNPDIRYTVQMIHRVHNPGTFQNAVQHHSPHDKKVQRTGQP